MPIKPSSIAYGFVTLLIGFAGGFAFAQNDTGHLGGEHGNPEQSSTANEAGQSAFAAVAEIVRLLENDPETNWSKVNVAALHRHLVDMSNLTLRSKAELKVRGMNVQFAITGDAPTILAAQNMVPAHARELDKMPNWSASGEVTPTGVTLTVIAEDEAALIKIKALGFFGLMATGAHHQPHHMAMARGNMMKH